MQGFFLLSYKIKPIKKKLEISKNFFVRTCHTVVSLIVNNVLVLESIIDSASQRGEELAYVIGDRSGGQLTHYQSSLYFLDSGVNSDVNITYATNLVK